MSQEFTVGINLAWLDREYDHDFGENHTRENDLGKKLPVAYETKKADFEEYIKGISELGVNVVRLWLFERFEGLTFGAQGTVGGHTSDIMYNLIDACKIAKKYNVKFYFCLMDTWGLSGDDVSEFRDHYISMINGLITTQEKRNTFLKVASELLNIKEIKELVWAVDVLNEPEGIEHGVISDYRGIPTNVLWSQIVEYIKDACSQIKQKTGHRVSCGFQKSQNLQRFKEQIEPYVDFFDFHEYNDAGDLPQYSNLGLAKPCIIGECGQDKKQVDDNLQKNVVKSFLSNAKRLGYSGCMPWRYGHKNYTDEYDRWNFMINSDGTRKAAAEEIKQFLDSQ